MKTHARVLGVALLAAGFLAGRGVALALDLGHPPAEVSATTTVGLTPVPMEGSGTREDEDAAADTADGADLDSAPGPALPPHAHPAAHPAGPADADADDEDDDEDEPAPSVQPQARGWAPPKAKPFKVGSELKAALDSLKVDGRQVSALRGGRRVATTLDPVLQQTAEHLLSDYDVPAGAVVVMEPGSGRVLAWPDAGVRSPSDLKELPLDDHTDTSVRVLAAQLSVLSAGDWRFAVRVDDNRYTPYLLLTVTA